MSNVIHASLDNGINTNDPNRKQISGKKELTPDDFITLFLKQLTTQNPLKPTDSSAVLQQMADVSSISANKDMQKTLKGLKQDIDMSLANTELLSATQLIGKRAEVPSDVSPLDKDEGLMGSVMLHGPATNIKVTIKNDQGEIVKELNLAPTKTGGLMPFKWDGMKDVTTSYEPGFYKFSAKATVDGKEIGLDTTGAYKVKSVASDPKTGKVILNLDGLGGLELNEVVKLL
jgi:flagellar basal-body rod modification protein FlgD